MLLVITILILLVTVALHEFGHYLAARLVGYVPPVFSVGFGKKLFGFTYKETEWRLSAIPLGGYVRIDYDDFRERPQRHLLVVALAGPAMNYLVAVVCLLGFTLSRESGRDKLSSRPVSTAVHIMDSPAVIGFESMKILPKAIFKPSHDEKLSGPVGIVSVGSDIGHEYGAVQGMLIFGALVNIGLMTFNLLPLPILDGGRALIALGNGVVSKFRRKESRLPKMAESILVGLSAVLILYILFRATISDIF